jgi:triosephosphate isomerase
MTRAEAGAFCDAFLPAIEQRGGGDAEVVLCPPFTALSEVAHRCAGTPVRVAAQNMHAEAEGAFTGEVSAAMLLDAGAWGVVLGHSERRQLFGETDEALAAKVPAALGAGLVPILCVGETEAERDGAETEVVLRRQLVADLERVAAERLGELVIAYEPIWAIGTGRTASLEQAQEAIGFIRSLLAERDAAAAGAVRILYGGSVKPANAAELLALPDVDGALVGGASLDPRDFLAIVSAAG